MKKWLREFFCGLNGHNATNNTIKNDRDEMVGYSSICSSCEKVLNCYTSPGLTESDYKFLGLKP